MKVSNETLKKEFPITVAFLKCLRWQELAVKKPGGKN